jgi:hypothetical protein
MLFAATVANTWSPQTTLLLVVPVAAGTTVAASDTSKKEGGLGFVAFPATAPR